MGWFNYYGLAVMAIIMIPNVVYAVKHKNDPANTVRNKAVVISEQIGRYGCFFLMIFQIPHTWLGFWFGRALTVYLSVNGGLCLAYLLFWGICYKRNDMFRALALSVIPSCIFLFSGVMLANFPLIVCALVFGVNHIFISYKNAVKPSRRKKYTVRAKLADETIALLILLLLVCGAIAFLFGTVV